MSLIETRTSLLSHQKMLIAVVDKKLLVILFLFLTLNVFLVSSNSENIEETILEGNRYCLTIFYTNLFPSNLKSRDVSFGGS